MAITTLVYIAFVMLFCLIYYVVPKKWQWKVLLVASLLFFILSSALLTLLMLATTVVIYVTAFMMQKELDAFELKKGNLDKAERKAEKIKVKNKQKRIVTFAVIVVVGILALTKYRNFLGDIVNGIGGVFGAGNIVPHFRILLPIGISYYTLMAVSYVVDVYRGAIKAEKNFGRLLLYVCYFPHIVEGPFDKYKELDTQFRTPHYFDYNRFRCGLILAMYGFLKKMVLADTLGLSVSHIFNNLEVYSGASLLIGMIMYTFQIYLDFSGCIDIVSGVSSIFSISLSDNFKQPFFSKSTNEFWRRWHISLGRWLKEYVFYPVSLSGHFKFVNQFTRKNIKNKNLLLLVPSAYALFFVWFCNGLWHGASAKYIVYGLYYYIIIVISESIKPKTAVISNKLQSGKGGKLFSLFQILRTFLIVNVGMLLFRSDTVSSFAHYIMKMLSSFSIHEIIAVLPARSVIVLLFLGISAVFIVDVLKEKGINTERWLVEHTFIVRWAVYLVLILTCLVMGIYGVEYGNAEGIYAQF